MDPIGWLVLSSPGRSRQPHRMYGAEVRDHFSGVSHRIGPSAFAVRRHRREPEGRLNGHGPLPGFAAVTILANAAAPRYPAWLECDG